VIREALSFLIDQARAASAKPMYETHPDGRRRVFLYAGGQNQGYQRHEDKGPDEVYPRHTFTHLVAFASWLLRERERDRCYPSDVTIMVGESKVTAAANDWQVEGLSVDCSLEDNAAWATWRRVCGPTWHDLDTIFDFVRTVQDTFAPRMARKKGADNKWVEVEADGAATILTSLMKLEVTDGSNMTVQKDPTGLVTFSGGETNTSVSGKIEPVWKLRLAPFLATPDIQVDVDVHVSMKWDREAKAMKFRLSMPTWREARREAQYELANKLQVVLGEDWLVGMGSRQTETIIGRVTD